jgi:type IX secretion system PorP/SprF family membrane protein
MKNFVSIFAFLFTALFVSGQQQPVISNYLSNPYIINKAYTGYKEDTEVSLLAKTFFVGFADKNPGFQSINLSTRTDFYGLGVALTNDYFGNTRSIGLGITYAYHIDMGNNAMSFALTPKFSQFSMNQTNYIYFDDNDDVITNAKENKIVFDADFGLLFYFDNYSAGISINNLLEPNVSLGGNVSDENRLLRSYNLIGAYNHSFSEDIKLEPSILLSYSPLNFYYDVNVRTHVKNLFWIGAGYKQVQAFNVMFGLDYKNYRFAYSYDHNLSAISKYSSGSHEICIGIRFGESSSKSKL